MVNDLFACNFVLLHTQKPNVRWLEEFDSVSLRLCNRYLILEAQLQQFEIRIIGLAVIVEYPN